MATSTITITYDGEPLVGAEVLSTAKNIITTTDANGQVTYSVADDYAVVVLMAVRHESFPMKAYIGLCLLEAGENYVLSIPFYAETEGGGPIRGIHCHFAEKV